MLTEEDWIWLLIEDPANTLPVFADWLAERNDPAEGLFRWFIRRTELEPKLRNVRPYRLERTYIWNDGNAYPRMPSDVPNIIYKVCISFIALFDAWKYIIDQWREFYKQGKLKDHYPYNLNAKVFHTSYY